MNRAVTIFLQFVDADVSGSILVAATDHVELLDRAMFRRFDVIVPFDKPTREQVVDLLQLRLASVWLSEEASERRARTAVGGSFADVARACGDGVRTMALDNRDEVSEPDVTTALEGLEQRGLPTRS